MNRFTRVVPAQGPGHGPWMRTEPDPHQRHRFPVEIVSHAVWLYHTFSLNLRDILGNLPGITVTVRFAASVSPV